MGADAQASEANRFEVRFIRAEEANRLACLIKELQDFQQLAGVLHTPSGQQVSSDLTRTLSDGSRLGNRLGTFVAVAVDKSKVESCKEDMAYIVGYMIYTQQYTIIAGRQLYLTSFFIEEAYRRHGLGKRMVLFMRNHGHSLGNSLFDVPFMLKNLNGIRFYNKMGAIKVSHEYLLSKAKFSLLS